MLALSNLYSNWNISREYFKTLTVSVLRFQCIVTMYTEIDGGFGRKSQNLSTAK